MEKICKCKIFNNLERIFKQINTEQPLFWLLECINIYNKY